MSDDQKPVVITTPIYPFDKGKRKVIVTGAPEGEMPIAHVGQFAELHALIDQVWLELLKRKPQVVKRANDKAKPKVAKAGDDTTSDETAETLAAAELAGQPANKQVVTSTGKDSSEPETLDDLPEIQNEQEIEA